MLLCKGGKGERTCFYSEHRQGSFSLCECPMWRGCNPINQGEFEMMLLSNPGPIGIFDSGYGGLTILHGLRQVLPQYDYMYLGDNARAPYGSRSFEVVYKFTRQAVIKLFSMGCHLVILGCNTASAKALRSIQQRDIPELDPNRRVLGIIRPTAEVIGNLTKADMWVFLLRKEPSRARATRWR